MDQDKRPNEQHTDWYAQNWCPWTWDPGLWGIALVLLGVGVVIAEVFNIDEFWEIAGGIILVALGISLLRAPFRRK